MSDIAGILPTKAEFAAAVNTNFRATAADDQFFEFLLFRIDELASNQVQEAFALQFLAPVTAPRAQGTYKLEHETLGTLELFLVPVKLDENGLYFEAIFNHFLGT